MKIVVQILGRMIQVGGEDASGWLPPNAAAAPSTPLRDHVVDFKILAEGGECGFILEWRSSSPHFWNDSWHATIEEALNYATERFGIDRTEWREPESN